MRVVAGSARGRTLRAPTGRSTRPTSDRVRESMFDMLTSLGAFEVAEGAGPDAAVASRAGTAGPRVVDLFAGSGALGIEARSRGAASVTFVESNPAAAATIGDNLRVLGWADGRSRVVQADVRSWVRNAGVPVVAGADLVLADPPYGFDRWERLLVDLAGSGFAGVAVLETGADVAAGSAWETLRARRYGTTVVQLVRPVQAAGVPVEPKGGV